MISCLCQCGGSCCFAQAFDKAYVDLEAGEELDQLTWAAPTCSSFLSNFTENSLCPFLKLISGLKTQRIFEFKKKVRRGSLLRAVLQVGHFAILGSVLESVLELRLGTALTGWKLQAGDTGF